MTTPTLHTPVSFGTACRAYIRSLYIAFFRERLIWLVLAFLFFVGMLLLGVHVRRVLSREHTQTVTVQVGPHARHRDAVLPIHAQHEGFITYYQRTETQIGDSSVTHVSVQLNGSGDGPKAWAWYGIILAILLAFRTWRDEHVSHRAYYLTMPVERTTNAFAKVLAGWSWLVVAIIASHVVVWLTMSLMWVIIHPTWAACHAQSMLQCAAGTSSLGQASMLFVLLPICAATITYCIVSAFIIGTESPKYWMGGILVAYFVLELWFNLMAWQGASSALGSLMTGALGLHTAAVGQALTDVATWGYASLLWLGIALIALGLSVRISALRRR